ncbi:MAG: acyl-CoA dehydratase activase, partial [Clostridiales Family XIII bacterium]|nr:acyl-CoA dehydratase activase [Clostridiales Family XIII bacterium]
EAGIVRADVRFAVVTGYGRITYQGADKQITEISCHAKGIDYLTDGVATVIDIGGQDAKVIRISDGKMENFTMNEKCASGTGRFLEVMARVLGCELGRLSNLADRATKEVSISSICTVFAESEVISNLAAGESIENVARGAHLSVAKRVAGMCGRVGVREKVVMSGGVALNANMVNAMEEVLGVPVVAAPHAQIVGAIGAAVLARELAQARRE